MILRLSGGPRGRVIDDLMICCPLSTYSVADTGEGRHGTPEYPVLVY